MCSFAVCEWGGQHFILKAVKPLVFALSLRFLSRLETSSGGEVLWARHAMTQQYRVAIGGVAEIGIATPHYFSICILTKP
jgi:hypothetical protein